MSLSQKVEEVKVLLDSVNKSYAPVVFANSFGAEDMVLTDLIGRIFQIFLCLLLIRSVSLKRLIV